ncbi:hypothetical protein ABK040_006714 [Willaertia magna]
MQDFSHQLYSVFLNTFSTNKSLQQVSEQQLTQWKSNEGFPSSILQLILTSQQSNAVEALHIQQAGAIYLKNLVNKHWNPKRRSLIEEAEEEEEQQQDGVVFEMALSDKNYLKTNILQALVQSKHVIQNQLCDVLRVMVYNDYPVSWNNLVDDILQLLQSNDISKVYGALLALDQLLKSYKFAFGEQYKMVVDDVVTRTSDVILNLFKYLLSQNTDEFAFMRKLACKVIWAGFYLGIPQYYSLEILNNSQFSRFDQLMQLLIDSFKMDVPQGNNFENQGNPHWKVKKWIGHFIYRLIAQFNTIDAKEPTEEERKLAKYFLQKWAIPFLEVMVSVVQLNLKNIFVPPRIITLALRVLDGCTSEPNIYNIAIKPKLKDIITNILFPYICFNQYDKETWENDPQEFLRIGYEMIEDLWNTRITAMGSLFNLIAERRKDVFPVYLAYVTEVLTNYQNGTNVNPSLKDGVLYSIGNLASIFVKSNMTKDKIEDLLTMFVFPEFTNNQYPYLRARACWLLGIFSLINWKNENTPIEGLKLILNCLQDKDIPVKIQAGLALSCLLHTDIAMQQVRPILPQLLEIYMNILNEMEHSTVVESIEKLIDAFAEDIEPYAISICSRMISTFIRLQEEEEDADLDHVEEETLMENCILTVLTLMRAFTSKPSIYRQLEPILLPFIAKVLESPEVGYDFIEYVMEMLTFLTYHCEGKISENCWKMLPIVYEAFKGWASDYIGYLVPPMDNYISVNTDVFLQNQDHVTMVYELCKVHLGADAQTCEKEAQGACKILSVMLQRCKGRIDNEVPKYLEMALEQLKLAETPAFTVLLFDLFADAICYNIDITLNYIESKQATFSVFGKWSNAFTLMHRIFDKKLTVLAFSTIIGYPNFANLPSPIQGNITHLVGSCVKLLIDIHQQRKVEEENKLKAEQERKELLENYYDSEEEEYNREDNNGGSATLSTLKKNPQLLKLAESLTNTSYDNQANDEEIDDTETIETVYDSIDENVYFGQSIISFSNRYQSQFQQIISQLGDEEKLALQQLMNSANQQ